MYAPEKQLGYFGGDEMNFRFPRYIRFALIMAREVHGAGWIVDELFGNLQRCVRVRG